MMMMHDSVKSAVHVLKWEFQKVHEEKKTLKYTLRSIGYNLSEPYNYCPLSRSDGVIANRKICHMGAGSSTNERAKRCK